MNKYAIIITWLSLILIISSHQLFAQKELPLLGQLSFPNGLNDIWGYVAEDGTEYAIVGRVDGVSIVDVSNPSEPVEVFFEEGVLNTWRDIKHFQNYIYVCTEGGGGITILDVSKLPNEVNVHSFNDNGKIDRAHNLWIDDDGFLYVIGFADIDNLLPTENRGVNIYNLNENPINPKYISSYLNAYCHDALVQDDVLYTSEVYNGELGIVDLRDKQQPKIVAKVKTPSEFTHNAWPSDDGKYIFTTDERRNGFVASYDISSYSDVKELDRYQSRPGADLIPHNAHYKDGFLHISYYTDGVRIVDAHQPDALTEVAYYDTSLDSLATSNGCWGAYPYLPSGNILASDRQEGLFIFAPDFEQAAFLAGNVTNAVDQRSIFGAKVELLNANNLRKSNIFGEYKIGHANEGTYDVRVIKYGYDTLIVNNVTLQSGETTMLDLALEPKPGALLTIKVMDDAGHSIEDVLVTGAYSEGNIYGNTREGGVYTVLNGLAFEDYYQVLISHWGYLPKDTVLYLHPDAPEATIVLENAYYDDFRTDLGWSVSGSANEDGNWVREVPLETIDLRPPIAGYANPKADAEGDKGDFCYMTGNRAGFADFSDLDDGIALLTSPKFDLTNYNNPEIKFALWFYSWDVEEAENGDEVEVRLLNGKESVVILEAEPDNYPLSFWWETSYFPASEIELTDAMQLVIKVTATSPIDKVTEAAFDAFAIVDHSDTEVGLPIVEENHFSFDCYPNFFTSETQLKSTFEEPLANHLFPLKVFDLQGRLILEKQIDVRQEVIVGKDWQKGIYLVSLNGMVRRVVKL